MVFLWLWQTAISKKKEKKKGLPKRGASWTEKNIGTQKKSLRNTNHGLYHLGGDALDQLTLAHKQKNITSNYGPVCGWKIHVHPLNHLQGSASTGRLQPRLTSMKSPCWISLYHHNCLKSVLRAEGHKNITRNGTGWGEPSAGVQHTGNFLLTAIACEQERVHTPYRSCQYSEKNNAPKLW